MQVTRISIDRLFNLGSYEHVKYSISVEIKEGESAKDAIIGLEKILTALAPESKCCVQGQGELDRGLHHIKEMVHSLETHGPEEFRRRHGHFEGTPEEYIERCTKSHDENAAKRKDYEARAAKARDLLDNLGGAAVWKDAKLDWESDCDDL